MGKIISITRPAPEGMKTAERKEKCKKCRATGQRHGLIDIIRVMFKRKPRQCQYCAGFGYILFPYRKDRRKLELQDRRIIKKATKKKIIG